MIWFLYEFADLIFNAAVSVNKTFTDGDLNIHFANKQGPVRTQTLKQMTWKLELKWHQTKFECFTLLRETK